MPEHLRTFIVLLLLATPTFLIAKGPACALATTVKDFERRRNAWFLVTCIAFLAHNFWIFIAVTAVLLFFLAPAESNKIALYFALLFAAPMVAADIGGLGIVNSLFGINYARLLSLIVLFPAYIVLRRQSGVTPFGKLLPDKLIAGYILLNIILMWPLMSMTATFRQGVFYAFVDIFLPYYVASRSLKNMVEFRDALMAFVVAALIIAVVGMFEFARHWLLYSPLQGAWGVNWGYGNYLGRGEVLRAQASTGQPIVLGYVMAVSIGFFIFLKKSVVNVQAWQLGLAVLIVGLLAPVSRGPWTGAAAMMLVFIVSGPSPSKGIMRVVMSGLLAIPLLLVIPGGSSVISALPIFGDGETKNITYRQRLLEVSIQVIMQNPFFGSHDFWRLPVMQQLIQGEGIIDLVNTYVGIGLANGLVGVSLFAGSFLAVSAGVLKTMRSVGDKRSEYYILGQALLAVIVGIMVTIFTTSSITIIPLVYWSVLGLGVAYMSLREYANVQESVSDGHARYPLRMKGKSYAGT